MSDTFIIDCPECKARVAAELLGKAEHTGVDRYEGEPFGERLYIGKCPICSSLLAGRSYQATFKGYNAPFDEWTNIVRIHPEPARSFLGAKVPKSVRESLAEAAMTFQVGAYTATCAMFGRALEALCRDVIEQYPPLVKSTKKKLTPAKELMLHEGLKQLKDGGHIDQRLYDWSQQLQKYRNMAAHPDDKVFSRQEVEDLQAFVYAIVEYVYDLSERYKDFTIRVEEEAKAKS